ncbi:MAG: transglutaminase N-terminal domain-containing protein [Reyranellaceae bacterium]
MTVLNVRHRTIYNYANPVSFGEHRLMCRPRDSHDLRLLDATLTISPPAAATRWIHDVFGNSIAITSFAAPAQQLVFESSFRAEHYPLPDRQIVLEEYASALPFAYAADEIPDLGRRTERHYPDPDRTIDLWARSFLDDSPDRSTMGVLVAMNQAIKAEFGYARREEEGTQLPADTLRTKSGSCRDFALLMMEAVRTYGLAAEFVSGYLYDEKLIGAQGGLVGGGETHAWLQVYLPGAGWVEFDPTNALVGGRNLIRIAVARDAAQAVPLAGSFVGQPGDFLGMEVNVEVTAE